jgi:hypothetical protein
MLGLYRDLTRLEIHQTFSHPPFQVSVNYGITVHTSILNSRGMVTLRRTRWGREIKRAEQRREEQREGVKESLNSFKSLTNVHAV